METLCFEGNYIKRFSRVKEFCNEKVEFVLDRFLRQFCNLWLEEEYTLQNGAGKYERVGLKRQDFRAGHYTRRIITARGVINLRVPRGQRKSYDFTLFKRFKRKTENFEDVVVEALLKGHSSRKASLFFAKLFGQSTISHQSAVSALRKFDGELSQWKRCSLKDNAVILVLDAVWLKGVIPYLKEAKPVLFAYGIYPDGSEEVLDFELTRGESGNAWNNFCQRLEQRGLHSVKLIVHDDLEAINQAVSFIWPKALNQACIFHIMQNFNKKLKGCPDKRLILDYASWLYEAQSEEEFYLWAQKFKNKWKRYRYHPAFKYLFSKLIDTIRYFELPKEFWPAAKTSNRLESLFGELKRRINVFRRFPNTDSCKRWLYALLTERSLVNNGATEYESQHSS
jgi:transposase-like protein